MATDEHDEDGVLISDEFTNPHKRQAMHEKRMRKMEAILPLLEPPKLLGRRRRAGHAWWVGARRKGSSARPCRSWQTKKALPPITSRSSGWFRSTATRSRRSLPSARSVIIVENNYSGQFARYLRSETGIVADGHIRKYDGEPFMPHHIVDGVKAILAGTTQKYVPVHEIMV